MTQIFQKTNNVEKLYVLGYNAGDYVVSQQDNDHGSGIPVTFSNDVLNTISEGMLDEIAAIRCDDMSCPLFTNEVFFWAFFRGYFDAIGNVTCIEDGHLECRVTLPDSFLRSFEKHVQVPYRKNIVEYIWTGNNALDLLYCLYQDSSPTTRKKNFYKTYVAWCNNIPALNATKDNADIVGLHANWAKTEANAHAPFKARASDSGFDLQLISVWKRSGNVTFYETGIAVAPDFGWYFMLVPRSSLAKSGYILANSVGIIDRAYTGSIKVPLIKIDPDAPDIELPFRAVQIIPCPIAHVQMKEIKKEELNSTSRAEGGFGSTNKN